MRDNFPLCGRFCQVFLYASLDTSRRKKSVLRPGSEGFPSVVPRVDLPWAPYRKNTHPHCRTVTAITSRRGGAVVHSNNRVENGSHLPANRWPLPLEDLRHGK